MLSGFEIFLDRIASDVVVSVGVSYFEYDYQKLIYIPTENPPLARSPMLVSSHNSNCDLFLVLNL